MSDLYLPTTTPTSTYQSEQPLPEAEARPIFGFLENLVTKVQHYFWVARFFSCKRRWMKPGRIHFMETFLLHIPTRYFLSSLFPVFYCEITLLNSAFLFIKSALGFVHF